MALPSDEVLSIWNRIMKYQVDFSFPLELPVYLNLPSWYAAERVLDLGSGDGYYATRLAEYFPDKHYSCVDIDQRAIDTGKERYGNLTGCRIEFSTEDVLQFRGDFPVALARLLVQHLNTPEELFSAAPNFVHTGGTLVVIDSDDRSRLFWPVEICRTIETFFGAFSEFQPGRKHSAEMTEIAKDYGFEIETNKTLLIPSSIPTYKSLFRESYQLFFEIVQKHYAMEYDYDSLFTELETWAREPRAYAQIGVNVSAYRLR